jgi:metal-sulfur cluster biosynthetic enzyme
MSENTIAPQHQEVIQHLKQVIEPTLQNDIVSFTATFQ